jgi:hypothetical protein
LKHRSENSPARGQILTVLHRQYRDIAQKTGEICTGLADLQPMLFKSDRLLVFNFKNLRIQNSLASLCVSLQFLAISRYCAELAPNAQRAKKFLIALIFATKH